MFFKRLKQGLGPNAIARFYNNYTASWMVFFKRFEPAIVRYQHSLTLFPHDERALHCLANLYVQDNQSYTAMSKGLSLFADLMITQPNNATYPFNTAFVLQGQGKHSEACELFTQALALDKNHDRAWYGLALSHMAQRDWASAQVALEHNTRLQPMSPYGWYQLAVTQAQQGLWAEAQDTGKHLMGFEPKFARGLLADLKTLKQLHNNPQNNLQNT
jgi:tetratricopeptide (TPR) repeat protein